VGGICARMPVLSAAERGVPVQRSAFGPNSVTALVKARSASEYDLKTEGEDAVGIDLSRRILIASLAVLGVWHGYPAQAKDRPVDLELVLAVDVSASMDFDELKLQRQGYVAAFRSPELINQIKSMPLGIAVAYVEWGDQDTQNVIVPWTLVRDEAGAEEIAVELETAPLGHAFGTSISGALMFANELFEDNGFTGARKTVDISGDGPNTAGAPVAQARTRSWTMASL
jgi:hypothetical protein